MPANVERAGDSWVLTWEQHQVGMGLERPRESSDGLHFEVTIESRSPAKRGPVLGPVRLNILSSDSQTRLANSLAKRVNGLGPEVWHGLVVEACHVVAAQYREPVPLVRLCDIEDMGPVDYLIPPLLPEGETTALYADGESAKSMLALRIAVSCATGVPLPWGTRPTKRVRVLYLDWETNARTIATRLERINQALDLNEEPDILYRGTHGGRTMRSLGEELPHLREEVQREHIGLVIVDSIGFAVSGPLTEDSTARQAMGDLRQLAPATRLVIAHLSRAEAEKPFGPVRPFGSAFFWNGMRSGIEIRRADDQPSPDAIELGVYHRKANDDGHAKPFGLRVRFGVDSGPIDFETADLGDVPDLAARTSLSQRLTAALRRGERDVPSLAEETGTAADVVRGTLRRMSNVIELRPGGGRGHPSVWGLSADG